MDLDLEDMIKYSLVGTFAYVVTLAIAYTVLIWLGLGSNAKDGSWGAAAEPLFIGMFESAKSPINDQSLPAERTRSPLFKACIVTIIFCLGAFGATVASPLFPDLIGDFSTRGKFFAATCFISSVTTGLIALIVAPFLRTAMEIFSVLLLYRLLFFLAAFSASLHTVAVALWTNQMIPVLDWSFHLELIIGIGLGWIGFIAFWLTTLFLYVQITVNNNGSANNVSPYEDTTVPVVINPMFVGKNEIKKTLKKILDALDIAGQYDDVFAQEGISSPEDVVVYSEDELVYAGLARVHARRLIQDCSNSKAYLDVAPAPFGFV